MNRSFAKPIQSLQPGHNTTAQALLLQRQCACGAAAQVSSQCEACREEELVQRKSGNGCSPVSEAPPSVHEVLRSSGQPLDQTTRAFFEPRFGHDFSKVRVHADGEASRSAAAVNALAYTVGEHIVIKAGRYDPVSKEGRQLLAHELTHVLQQGAVRHPAVADTLVDAGTKVESVPLGQARLEIGEPDDRFEREADRIADRIVSGATASVAAPSSESSVDVTAGLTPSPVVRRLLQRQPQPQPPAAGTCPNDVAFSTGNVNVHVPLCGISNVTASTVPASIPGIVWSLAASTAQVASGTAIGRSNGQITFGTAQTGGRVNVTATQPTSTVGGPCSASAELLLDSHPSTISSTFVVGPLASTRTQYGAVFDHNFSSADGRVASIENVPVGEEFSGVPNPTATIHTITTPFGDFDLTTRNLTPTATNNWFVTGGSLGGIHDSVSIDRSLPKVGEFLASASNPTPANTLPVGFTVTQGLFWFCRQAPAASAWTKIRDVDHVRTLRLDSTGTGVEFVVSVNGEENAEPYTGQPAIINASASPATIPPTPARVRGGPAPTPSTTTISADPRPDPMPSGHSLRFSIRGAALGCSVNATTGVFTAGTATGTVTVRVRDSARANTNFDEVVVTIANPTPPTPAPTQPQPGQPNPTPGPGPQPPSGPPAVQPKQSDSFLRSKKGNIEVIPGLESLGETLPVSEPGDSFEREADEIADRVMTQLPPTDLPPQSHQGIVPYTQRFAVTRSSPTRISPLIDQGLSTSWQPLEASDRSFMEHRFGHSFADVRVHSDSRAADSALAIGARAYTVGRDIVFAQGEYDPRSERGGRLLAHELTHTIQQSVGSTNGVSESSSFPDRQSGSARWLSPVAKMGIPTMPVQRQPDDKTADDPNAMGYIFAGDKQLKTDKSFAGQNGEDMAVRLLVAGYLPADLRAELNGMLAFFEGEAKEEYTRRILPSLKLVANKPSPPEENDPQHFHSYGFIGSEEKKTDKKLALRLGQEIAASIRLAGEVTYDDRLRMKGMLAFFIGDAREEYEKQIKVALVRRPGGETAHVETTSHCDVAKETVLTYEDQPGKERCVAAGDPEFIQNYIDNYIVLATGLALPGTTWGNITQDSIPQIRLTYKDGRILVLDVKDIPLDKSVPKVIHPHGVFASALNPRVRYEKRTDGFIYPMSRGVPSVDYVDYNQTPNILSLRAGLVDAVEELQRSFQLVEATVEFANAVAQLGDIAAMNQHFNTGGLFEALPGGKKSRAKAGTDEPAPTAKTAQEQTETTTQTTSKQTGVHEGEEGGTTTVKRTDEPSDAKGGRKAQTSKGGKPDDEAKGKAKGSSRKQGDDPEEGKGSAKRRTAADDEKRQQQQRDEEAAARQKKQDDEAKARRLQEEKAAEQKLEEKRAAEFEQKKQTRLAEIDKEVAQNEAQIKPLQENLKQAKRDHDAKVSKYTSTPRGGDDNQAMLAQKAQRAAAKKEMDKAQTKIDDIEAQIAEIKGRNNKLHEEALALKKPKIGPGPGEPHGGAYEDVYKVGMGGHVHHIPADSTTRLSRGKGPAIWMEEADHIKTKSYGSGKKAQEWRAQQKALIDKGKFREAVEMDVQDIRKQFGNKYEKGIKEMLAYVETLYR